MKPSAAFMITADDPRRTGTTGRSAWLLGIGSVFFLAGSLVYLTSRPLGLDLLGRTEPLVDLSAATWLVHLRDALPTLAHVVAFSLSTAACLPPGRLAAVGACVAWAGINVVFELGQQRRLSALLCGGDVGLDRIDPIGPLLCRYFVNGQFDRLDLAFALIGAGLAYLLIRRVDRFDDRGLTT